MATRDEGHIWIGMVHDPKSGYYASVRAIRRPGEHQRQYDVMGISKNPDDLKREARGMGLPTPRDIVVGDPKASIEDQSIGPIAWDMGADAIARTFVQDIKQAFPDMNITRLEVRHPSFDLAEKIRAYNEEKHHKEQEQQSREADIEEPVVLEAAAEAAERVQRLSENITIVNPDEQLLENLYEAVRHQAEELGLDPDTHLQLAQDNDFWNSLEELGISGLTPEQKHLAYQMYQQDDLTTENLWAGINAMDDIDPADADLPPIDQEPLPFGLSPEEIEDLRQAYSAPEGVEFDPGIILEADRLYDDDYIDEQLEMGPPEPTETPTAEVNLDEVHNLPLDPNAGEAAEFPGSESMGYTEHPGDYGLSGEYDLDVVFPDDPNWAQAVTGEVGPEDFDDPDMGVGAEPTGPKPDAGPSGAEVDPVYDLDSNYTVSGFRTEGAEADISRSEPEQSYNDKFAEATSLGYSGADAHAYALGYGQIEGAGEQQELTVSVYQNYARQLANAAEQNPEYAEALNAAAVAMSNFPSANDAVYRQGREKSKSSDGPKKGVGKKLSR